MKMKEKINKENSGNRRSNTRQRRGNSQDDDLESFLVDRGGAGLQIYQSTLEQRNRQL